MGNLLRVLNDKGTVPKVEFFVDFEKAAPNDREKEVHSQVDSVLVKAPEILEELKSYKGAGEQIREAISNPNSEEHQEAAWQRVLPLVSQLRKFYEYAIELETALCQLLSVLCSPEMDALRHLEQQQAITKQFAEVLHFTLSFDETKMRSPAIQNDFSYYRRTLNRRKMEDVSAGVNSSAAELPDDIANKMSLFYANPTPMLNTLSGATEKFIQENPSLTLGNATDCFCTMASVCRVLNENPGYRSRMANKETRLFCLRVMVGVIILFDHVDPVGAFQKKSAIDTLLLFFCNIKKLGVAWGRGTACSMKSSIKVIKDFPSVSESLMNALRYSTKHFNDETTPKAIKDLLT